jgi:AcrR family transcriptional regulator
VFAAAVTAAAKRRSAVTVRSTRERLLTTAERLFALHGMDGVSLRQIGAAAGMGNNSAVQYHFGSKEGLARAILLHRLPALIQRRKLLSLRADANDLRAVVEAHLLPVIEQAEDESSYYTMFLEQLMRYGIDEHPFAGLPAAYQASQKAYVARVGRMLGHLPPALRTDRINQASAINLHASADRERARHFGAKTLPFALHVSELFDGLIGFLLAPASDETLAALGGGRSVRGTRRVVVS